MPTRKHPEGENKLRTLNIFGLEIPLTNWAVSLIAGVAVLSVIGIAYLKLVYPYINKPDLQQGEYQKHFSEPPDWSTTALNGNLQVAHYSSDDCLLVGRRNKPTDPLIQVWIIDSSRIPAQSQAAPGKITQVEGLIKEAVAMGRCLNPHPGNFRTWNGQQNGVWLQVWRQWPDGCTHYQWFNTQYNYWDTNPDGSPRVYWTVCNH